MDSNQCEDDMVCAIDNSTKTTGFNRNTNTNFPQPQVKLCLCDEANGVVEDVKDNSCNGTSKKSFSLINKRTPYITLHHHTTPHLTDIYRDNV